MAWVILANPHGLIIFSMFGHEHELLVSLWSLIVTHEKLWRGTGRNQVNDSKTTSESEVVLARRCYIRLHIIFNSKQNDKHYFSMRTEWKAKSTAMLATWSKNVYICECLNICFLILFGNRPIGYQKEIRLRWASCSPKTATQPPSPLFVLWAPPTMFAENHKFPPFWNGKQMKTVM